LTSFAKISLAALLSAVAAGGCGRAGPLEPPPDAQAVAKTSDQSSDNTGGVPKPHQRPPAIQPPKQPFFLDFLL